MYRAALLALIVAAPLSGAPVPPPPKELTAELLVGAWRYEFGTYRDGRMWLFADGTYVARHSADAHAVYAGDWRLERGTLVLTEFWFDPDLGRVSEPTVFRLTFDLRAYPRLVGTSNGDTRVALSDPKR